MVLELRRTLTWPMHDPTPAIVDRKISFAKPSVVCSNATAPWRCPRHWFEWQLAIGKVTNFVVQCFHAYAHGCQSSNCACRALIMATHYYSIVVGQVASEVLVTSNLISKLLTAITSSWESQPGTFVEASHFQISPLSGISKLEHLSLSCRTSPSPTKSLLLLPRS